MKCSVGTAIGSDSEGWHTVDAFSGTVPENNHKKDVLGVTLSISQKHLKMY